jgi:molybdopterin molybdotransferase
MTRRWHGQVVDRQILPDDRAQLPHAAEQALERADVVIVTGGASVGEKDFAKEMFADLAIVFSKVAIRPGKPVWLGTVGKTVILGLPGNPTSAVVTARLYLAPLLLGLAGYKAETAWNWQTMSVNVPLEAAGDRDTFLCAKSTDCGVVPLRQQDSAAQRSLANTEFLIHRRANAPSTLAGAPAEVLPL